LRRTIALGSGGALDSIVPARAEADWRSDEGSLAYGIDMSTSTKTSSLGTSSCTGPEPGKAAAEAGISMSISVPTTFSAWIEPRVADRGSAAIDLRDSEVLGIPSSGPIGG